MGRMAAMTGPERNEFLLLADVIGVSQLIGSRITINRASRLGSRWSGLSSGPMHRFAKEERLT